MLGVGIAVAIAVVFGALDGLSGQGGAAASASRSDAPRQQIIAQPGDTLWDIAGEHHGKVSVTRYVDALVELNGGASINVGQVITLP